MIPVTQMIFRCIQRTVQAVGMIDPAEIDDLIERIRRMARAMNATFVVDDEKLQTFKKSNEGR